LRSSALRWRLDEGAAAGPSDSGSLHAGQRLAKPGLSGRNSNSSEHITQILIGKAISFYFKGKISQKKRREGSKKPSDRIERSAAQTHALRRPGEAKAAESRIVALSVATEEAPQRAEQPYTGHSAR
jgi:hypothetical protein